MSKELSTLVKTGVVQIGWPRLYEAQSFKADKNGKPDLVQEFDENALLDDADRRHADSINDALKNYDAAEDDPKRPELDMDALEDVSNPAHLKNAMLLLKYVKSHFSTTVAGKPSYSLTVLFDKDDPSQARNIKMLREGQLNAMKNAVAKKTWMKATIQTASRAMQDCDTDVQTYGTGDNAKQMTAAQKYPERANHWYLNAKAKRRPDIYYLSEANKFVKLPDPILMPESDEEREQALQIEELWNKWVYPGPERDAGRDVQGMDQSRRRRRLLPSGGRVHHRRRREARRILVRRDLRRRGPSGGGRMAEEERPRFRPGDRQGRPRGTGHDGRRRGFRSRRDHRGDH